MEFILQIILTSVITTLLLGLFISWFFNYKVKPYLDTKIEDFRKISAEMETNIKDGVKQGVSESLKELPGTTVKETTRSVAKIGTELVEGGISAIFKDKR